MRLSFIFELLLIFIFIAFAASRVIEETKVRNGSDRKPHRRHDTALNNRQQVQDAANKYCSCNTKLCNCCREFNLPVVALQGPGCASLQYLRGDKLAISMSFGDRVLTNTTIDSKKPRPVCMPLPGGVSKFCGRVYNIGRKGEDFNACLGLELRTIRDVEAALRVSCFKFGPKGFKVEEAQPLPTVSQPLGNKDDDDDDDDDDDEDDEFDFDEEEEEEEEEDDEEDEDGENTVDYGTFSVFDDDFLDNLFVSGGSESGGNKKKKVVTVTKAPVRTVTRKPINKVKPIISTPAPLLLKDATNKPTTERNSAKSSTPRSTSTSTTPSTTTTTTRSTSSTSTTPRIRRKTRPVNRLPVTTTPVSTTSSQTQKVIRGKPLLASTKVIPGTEVLTTLRPNTKRRIPPTLTVSKRATTIPPATSPTTLTLPTTTSASEAIKLTMSTTVMNSLNEQSIFVSDLPASDKVVDEQALTMMTNNVSSNEIISHPEESIAALTAMLQESEHSTLKPYASTLLDEEIKATIFSSTAGTTQVFEDETTTTTVTTPIMDDDDEEDEDDSNAGSYILKDNEESEGVDDDVTSTFATTEQPDSTTIALGKEITANISVAESKDVLSDIVDGVLETLGAGSSSEEKKTPAKDDDDYNNDEDDDDDDDDFLGLDEESEKDDDDDDDEDDEKLKKKRKKPLKKLSGTEKKPVKEEDDDDDADDDDDEGEVREKYAIEDDDDDEDDEDDALIGRRAKHHHHQHHQKEGEARGRQSRDMWLERLHW